MSKKQRHPSTTTRQTSTTASTGSTRTATAKPSSEKMSAESRRSSSINTTETRAAAGRGRRRTQKRVPPWAFIGGIVALAVIVVGVFIFLSKQQSGSQYPSAPLDPTVLTAITNAATDTSTSATINTGGVTQPFTAPSDNPGLLKGSTGKPEVLYYGAEYCPNCAVERWSVAIALSRFGTFSKLSEISSSSTDTPASIATLSFYGSSYSSQYIDFAPIEQEADQGVKLQDPTADQAPIISKYNPGGSYPFIDIGNRYLVTGASFQPSVLSGLSHQEIASHLSNPSTDAAKNIIGTANYITAAICSLTNNQPSSVCSADPIKTIQQGLPKISASQAFPSGLAYEPDAVVSDRRNV